MTSRRSDKQRLRFQEGQGWQPPPPPPPLAKYVSRNGLTIGGLIRNLDNLVHNMFPDWNGMTYKCK